MEKKKREMGRYFTMGNPFQTNAFRIWARDLAIANGRALEPFAGCGNIPMLLEQAGYDLRFSKFDIQPAQKGIVKRVSEQAHGLCVSSWGNVCRHRATRWNGFVWQ